MSLVALIAVALDRSGQDGPQRPGATDPSFAQPTPTDATALRLASEDGAIDRVLGHVPFVAHGSSRRRDIALTFDDGPGPTTPALLNYLQAARVPATFFLIGRAIAQHSDLVRRELEAGFSIGAHADNHVPLATLTGAKQKQEILTSADRITRISRHAVRMFRPPFGSWDARTLEILRAERMLMILWSVDPGDHDAKSPRPIVRAALAGAKPGAVLLLHDGPGPRPHTLAAVRTIVPELRRRGYRFVSVPELLRG